MIITALQTPRLELLPVVLADLDDVHALNSLPETNRYNPSGTPENLAQSRFAIEAWVAENHKAEPNRVIWSIRLPENESLIGLAGMTLGKGQYRNAEVWYKLHPDHWGRGYATEALQAILDFGFEILKLHRIEAGCAVENLASIKVLQKVGMTREARRRALLPLQTGRSDNYEFAILETDPRTEAGRGR